MTDCIKTLSMDLKITKMRSTHFRRIKTSFSNRNRFKIPSLSHYKRLKRNKQMNLCQFLISKIINPKLYQSVQLLKPKSTNHQTNKKPNNIQSNP